MPFTIPETDHEESAAPSTFRIPDTDRVAPAQTLPSPPAPRSEARPQFTVRDMLERAAGPFGPAVRAGAGFTDAVANAMKPAPAAEVRERVAAVAQLTPEQASSKLTDRLYSSNEEREALLDRIYGRGALRTIMGGVQRVAEPVDWIADAGGRALTLGLSDEAAALGSTIGQAVRNVPAAVTGTQPRTRALQAATQTLQNVRESAARDRENPATVGVELASGLGLPIGQLYQRLISAGMKPWQAVATLSGGTGALFGVGESDPAADANIVEHIGTRAGGGALGTLIGTGTGLGLHAGLPFAQRLFPGVRHALGEFGTRIKGAFTRGGEDRLPTAREIERGRGAAHQIVSDIYERLTPAQRIGLSANPMEARGMPVTSAEALGREAETQLKVAGRRSGQTPATLEATLRDRAAMTPEEVLDDFARVTDLRPNEIRGDYAALVARLRAEAKPFYDEFYKIGPVHSEEFAQIVDDPFVQKAIPLARMLAISERRQLGAQGFRSVTRPIELDGVPLLHANGSPVMVEDRVTVLNPTTQTWDYIKRALDDQLQSHSVNGKIHWDNETRAIQAVKDRLVDALDEATDGAYERVLDKGGEALRLEKMFRLAPRLMSNSTNHQAFSDDFAKLSTAQKEALRAAAVQHAFETVSGGRLRIGDLLTPNYKQKLNLLFGHGRARDLIQRLEDRRFLLQHGARMTPGVGSDTSETLLGSAEQDRQIGRALQAIVTLARGNIFGSVANLLASPAGIWRGLQLPVSRATRDALGEMLMAPPSVTHQDLMRWRALRNMGAPNESRAPVGGAVRAALARQAAVEAVDAEP